MRKNMLSRRSIVYAILLVAVFLLLALVVSGCTTEGVTIVRSFVGITVT